MMVNVAVKTNKKSNGESSDNSITITKMFVMKLYYETCKL